MEEKGLARAVGALRAELHSFGLSGARIVIEVTPAQWHALRAKSGKLGDVEQLELVSDVMNGDVVVRPAAAAESIAKTVEQLADMGLQSPTLEQRVESIEKVLGPRLGLAVDTLADVVRRLEKLEHWCKPGEAPAPLLEQLDDVRERLEPLERFVASRGHR